mmetsp:Transcript_12986/g.23803  ORF Transcript_12986/g.23803 Transcript_12986/m.23803 type:complete len:205 (+) Transcript_12986:2039-2653(+)
MMGMRRRIETPPPWSIPLWPFSLSSSAWPRDPRFGLGSRTASGRPEMTASTPRNGSSSTSTAPPGAQVATGAHRQIQSSEWYGLASSTWPWRWRRVGLVRKSIYPRSRFRFSKASCRAAKCSPGSAIFPRRLRRSVPSTRLGGPSSERRGWQGPPATGSKVSRRSSKTAAAVSGWMTTLTTTERKNQMTRKACSVSAGTSAWGG